MKTIQFTGTEEQIETFRSSLSFNINEMPKAVEVRVYVVDVDDNNYNGDETSDEDFMDMAEADGRVYSLDGFQYAFNFGEVNTNTDVIRFITQPLNL